MADHGKDATLELDDNDAGGISLQDISAYVDTSNLTQAFELAGVTAYGDEDRNFISGLATGSISVGGPWDATLDGYIGSSQDLETARSVRYRPQGDASPSYTMEAFIESYTIDAPVGDNVTWSATLRPTDTISRA